MSPAFFGKAWSIAAMGESLLSGVINSSGVSQTHPVRLT